MREDEYDEILRTEPRPKVTPPRLEQQTQRRGAKVAILIIALVVSGLVIVPVALALSGDPYQLLFGFALGDPFGF